MDQAEEAEPCYARLPAAAAVVEEAGAEAEVSSLCSAAVDGAG
jgi:hypothetical protein